MKQLVGLAITTTEQPPIDVGIGERWRTRIPRTQTPRSRTRVQRSVEERHFFVALSWSRASA